jgi:hypothetical protein
MDFDLEHQILATLPTVGASLSTRADGHAKSRGRKNRSSERISKRQIAERTRAILEAQRQRFRAKFGRDPWPHDPVFFDPNAIEPVPMYTVAPLSQVLQLSGI